MYWKGSRYSPGDKYTVTGDHTFTAVWEKNSNPSNVPDSPKTGDPAQSWFWLTLLLLMAGLIVITAKMKRRFK